MARPQVTASNPRRQRLSMVLIGAFALQTVLRLILMPTLYGMARLSPVVHLANLAAVGSIVALLFAAGGGSRWVRAVIGSALATLWLILTMFDIDAMVARHFGFKPLSITGLTVFYCEQKSLLACLGDYPAMLWQVVAPLILSAVALAALLTTQINPIADTLRGPVQGVGRWISTRSGIDLRHWALGFVVLMVVVWTLAPHAMLRREPLTRVLYFAPFDQGPQGLVDRRRPDYLVKASPGSSPRTLVLITVDSLRHDWVSLDPGKPTATPFLRALAATGRLHDLGPAIAICGASFCGIVALHSASHWATQANGPPLMLADVLAANGYRSHFLLSGPHRSLANLKQIYGPNVTTLLDDISPDSSMRADDREQVRRLTALKVDDPRKTFIAVHLMSAHALGLRFASGARPSSGPVLRDYRRHYANGVRQADHVIEQLFAVMRRKGLLDDALVVITSDHGESIDQAGTGHGDGISPAIASIPLLVYDTRGERWGRHPVVSQADVAPTMLDAAGIGIPGGWQGNSLIKAPLRRVAPIDDREHNGMVVQIAGRLLFLRCEIRGGAVSVEGLDGKPVWPAQRAAALRAAPGLYATVERRKDGGKCFEMAGERASGSTGR